MSKVQGEQTTVALLAFGNHEKITASMALGCAANIPEHRATPAIMSPQPENPNPLRDDVAAGTKWKKASAQGLIGFELYEPNRLAHHGPPAMRFISETFSHIDRMNTSLFAGCSRCLRSSILWRGTRAGASPYAMFPLLKDHRGAPNCRVKFSVFRS
jgi:hypothetical protein